MKKINKALACLLSIAMILSISFVPANAVETDGQNENPDTLQANQFESYFNYKRLIYSFENKYPYWYGGAFLNENSNLEINVNIATIEDLDKIQAYIQRYIPKDQYIINISDCAYKELKMLMDDVDDFVRKSPGSNVRKNMDEWYIDEVKSRIVVSLLDTSPSKIDEFRRKFVSTDLFEFKEETSASSKTIENNQFNNSADSLRQDNNVTLGTAIYNNDGNRIHGATIGYKAKIKDTDTVGVVTVGHLFSNLYMDDTNIKCGSEFKYFGSAGRYIQKEGKFDGAFVKQENEFFNISNTLPNGKSLSNYPQEGIQGMKIFKEGAVTNKTEGHVKSTHFSYILRDEYGRNERFLEDQINTSAKGFVGDSGGILCFEGDNYCHPMGIQVSTKASDDTASFSKISNINQKYGLEMCD